jgi:hypothetical protein
MSYYDTCKKAKSSDLVALKANVQKVDYTATHTGKNTIKGSFSFERVQPRNSNYTIKNIYLKVILKLTITRSAQAPAEGEPDYRDDYNYRFDDFNAAMYGTSVTINGSIQNTQEPYLNRLIKKNYDEKEYVESMNEKNSPYVYVNITHTPGSPVENVEYVSCAPIYHSYLCEDVTGINNLMISSNYNIFNIVKLNYNSNNTINNITFQDGKEIDIKLIYDEVINTDLSPDGKYYTACMQYMYYTGNDMKTSADHGKLTSDNNIRDTRTQPLRVFNMIVPDIINDGARCTYAIKGHISSVSWDVNNKLNLVNTSGDDMDSEIYSVCKDAGLFTEFSVFRNEKQLNREISYLDPIISLSMLNTPDAKISTADLFRLSSKMTYEYNEGLGDITKKNICVYEYPAIIKISPIENTVQYSLIGVMDELIESEAGLDEYMDDLEDLGYSGDGKVADWFRKIGRKIKEGRFISKILGGISKGADIFTKIAPMIPGIGAAAAPIASQVSDISKKVGNVAADAGYGISTMF